MNSKNLKYLLFMVLLCSCLSAPKKHGSQTGSDPRPPIGGDSRPPIDGGLILRESSSVINNSKYKVIKIETGFGIDLVGVALEDEKNETHNIGFVMEKQELDIIKNAKSKNLFVSIKVKDTEGMVITSHEGSMLSSVNGQRISQLFIVEEVTIL